MVVSEPPIPLIKITEISAAYNKKLAKAGLIDLAQLFLHESKLWSAIDLSKATTLSVQETLGIRQKGRQHLSTILAEIAAKRKVEPLELLWKVHWLIGATPSGEGRQEVVTQETAALTTITKTLEHVDAPTIDRILVLLIHRTLIVPPKEMNAELRQLISIAEKFQRVSLLAYQIRKMKPILLAIAEAEEPAQRIAALRKVTVQWKQLLKILKERNNTLGQNVVIARQASDSLSVLDLSEKYLKDRVEKSMSMKKLRQSQLTHITAMMNAAVDLRDAYLVTQLAERASQIWFELAQGKPSKAFTDDLLRSLRFARTAIFHSRVLDDVKSIVRMLKHLSHLIGEFPPDIPESLLEAAIGTMKTFINTAPLLDRPADMQIILDFLQHTQSAGSSLQKLLTDGDKRRKLIQLQIEVQQIALEQLEQLGADSSVYSIIYRELVQSLLTLVDTTKGDEQRGFLEETVKYANKLLAQAKTKTHPIEQDMIIISAVTSHLSQFREEDLSDVAEQLIARSNQLIEQLYFESSDPKVRAKLALQLLLSKLSPDSVGQITLPSSSKEFDKLEEYASKALVEHAKTGQKTNALKAGSILVALTLHRVQKSTDEEQRLRLKEDTHDFADKTFSFMSDPTEMPGEEYPFALLLLRSINDLVHGEKPAEDSKWESLLKRGEQLAQMMATVSTKRSDTMNQILALSAAASATAKLAALSPLTSQRTKLLARSTTQIQKALSAATSIEKPDIIKAVIAQYNRIMQTRLITTPKIQDQIEIFSEWSNTLRQGVKGLEEADADEIADWLEAYRILNTEIPATFMQLSHPTFSLDAAKRKIAKLLQEVGKRGSKEQVELAKDLERRWTFQLGADTIIASGFRLEDAEISFTLADEQFRISIQVEEHIEITEKVVEKKHSFPYLRPSTQMDSIIWYETTPVLCAIFGETELLRWLAIDDPSNHTVTVRLWLVSPRELSVKYTLEIPSEEPPTKTQEGVIIISSGGKILFPEHPSTIEHRQDRCILINQILLEPGQPKPLAIQILLE